MADGDLRKIYSTHLSQAVWQAIETWSTGQGVPDCHFCFPGGRMGWIENKKTEANAVRVDTEQVGWAERYARKGGKTFFGVRKIASQGVRRIGCDEFHLFTSGGGRYLKMDGLTGVPQEFRIGMWAGGPAAWDWDAIARALCR